MIKGIFCHDLPIYKDIDGNYCSTTLTDSLFLRYFNVVDELVIAIVLLISTHRTNKWFSEKQYANYE